MSAVSSIAGSAAITALAASESGTRSRGDGRADLGGAAELGEIAGEAVRDIHGSGGMGAHGFGQRIARLRQQITREQMLALRLGQLPVLALAHRKPERGVADGARNEDAVAGLGAGAAHHGALRHAAEHRDRDRDRPGRAVGIAAEQRAAVEHGVAAQAFGKVGEPTLADIGRQREAEQEAERLGALRRQVGQVHAQRLAGYVLRRVVGKEMHAADDSVGLEHEIAAGRRLDEGGIVGQAERAGMDGDRREVARDQFVLGGRFVRQFVCHGVRRP